MKAVVYTSFGPPEVLSLQERPAPVPGHDEVLVRVAATSVTAADCMVRRGRPLWGRLILGIRRPSRQVIGTEFSGTIETVGRDVRTFAPGDKVFGLTGFRLGAYAQFVCLPEQGSLAHAPSSITIGDAVAYVDGATTAIFFLKHLAGVRAGDRVLIIGASGSIGTFAVQIAAWLGAEVTGVCGTLNVDLVRSLGANRVIDYSKHDFTEENQTYDIIFDTVTKSSFQRCKKSLTPQGRYIPTTGLLNFVSSFWTSLWGGRRVLAGMSVEKKAALELVRDLVDAGKLRSIIDRRYPVDRIAEAHAYVEAGHKKGNVVIEMGSDWPS